MARRSRKILIPVEVFLKVACWSTDCSTELLILVEVSVKVACRSTTTTDLRNRVTSIRISSHHHATYCGGSACESGLSVHDSHRLKVQSYLHATYPGGSIYECSLSVHDSHRLKAQSYLHATYFGGSISVNVSSETTFTLIISTNYQYHAFSC